MRANSDYIKKKAELNRQLARLARAKEHVTRKREILERLPRTSL